MDVRGSLQRLFERRRVTKAPELASSVVVHDLVDEFIRDELREQAPLFDSALDYVPSLEAEHDENGVQTMPEQRVEVAPDLWSDTFLALHDRKDQVQVRPAHEVKPSNEIVRQVIAEAINHEDFAATRSRTRDDRITSALAMMNMQDALDEELRTTLKEHMRRAEEMRQQQDTMRDAEQQLGDLRDQARQEAAGGGGVPDWLKQQIKDLAQQKANARQGLEQNVQAQQAGLNMAAAQAVENVVEAGQEAAEAWANLPGNGVGEHSNIAPDKAIELGRRFLENDYAQKVAEAMGRMERDFRFKHSTRTVGGREIPVDVELGNDLSAVLPSELVKLGVPELRGLFYKQYAERQLLQYEMVGTAESGKGPLILCIDFSGSMSVNDKHIGAKAVALSLLTIARRENRPVHVIAVDTAILGEWRFPARGDVNLEDVLALSSLSPSGGTRLYPSLERAEEILIQAPEFKQADVVLITDGESSFSGEVRSPDGEGYDLTLSEDFRWRTRLTERGVRIHGISIEAGITTYLSMLCDPVIPVADFAAPNEATDHLVQSVV